jgi:hypothetical protein
MQDRDTEASTPLATSTAPVALRQSRILRTITDSHIESAHDQSLRAISRRNPVLLRLRCLVLNHLCLVLFRPRQLPLHTASPNPIKKSGTIENLVGKGKRGAEPDSNTPNERQEWVRTALCDGKPPDSLDPWPSGPPNLEGARRGFRGLGTRHQAIPQPILGADCPPATH